MTNVIELNKDILGRRFYARVIGFDFLQVVEPIRVDDNVIMYEIVGPGHQVFAHTNDSDVVLVQPVGEVDLE